MKNTEKAESAMAIVSQVTTDLEGFQEAGPDYKETAYTLNGEEIKDAE